MISIGRYTACRIFVVDPLASSASVDVQEKLQNATDGMEDTSQDSPTSLLKADRLRHFYPFVEAHRLGKLPVAEEEPPIFPFGLSQGQLK
jgi:hypothetical protein